MNDSTLVYQNVPTLYQFADSCLVQSLKDSGFEFIDYYQEKNESFSRAYYLKEIPLRYATPSILASLIRDSLYKARYTDDSLCNAKAKLAIGAIGFYFGVYQPAPSDKDSGLMAIYATKADFDRETSDSMGKRTIGKPAKILRKVFPWLPESVCNWFAEQWKEAFLPESLTIKTGKDRESFKRAYSHEQTNCKNPCYDRREGLAIKSLSGSCMRHSFGEFHPSEVYASGDFESIWAEDEKGRIAARVVVNTSKQGESCFIPAPIYTNSDNAANFILEYLNTRGYNWKDSVNWSGAELLAIPHNGDSYLMPYIDVEQDLDLQGDRFILGQGESKANETRGYIYAQNFACHCESCGEGIREDDYQHWDEDSCETYCESCTNYRFTICEGTGELTPNDSIVLVYDIRHSFLTNRFYRDESHYSESYAMDNCTLANDGNWYNSESCEYSDYIGESIPRDEIGDSCDYVQTESDIYERAECVKLPNGSWIHVETELDFETWNYDTNTNTVTLKVHLELDESGNVINRQTELDLAA